MKYIKIVNWEKYQHYKERNPPWIKLHNQLLDNYEYGCLQDASKLLLMSFYLLASRTDNSIPADPEWIRSKSMLKGKVDWEPLVTAGFITTNGDCLQDASKMLAGCQQNADSETETETERETEKDIVVKDDIAKIPFREIVEHLNLKTGMSFRASTKQTQTLIRARWKEGFKLDDFKKVIDRMYDAWGADSKMMQYLRPITLFGTKFEGYLNRPEKHETEGKPF